MAQKHAATKIALQTPASGAQPAEVRRGKGHLCRALQLGQAKAANRAAYETKDARRTARKTDARRTATMASLVGCKQCQATGQVHGLSRIAQVGECTYTSLLLPPPHIHITSTSQQRHNHTTPLPTATAQTARGAPIQAQQPSSAPQMHAGNSPPSKN